MEEQIAGFLASLNGDRGFSGNTVAAYRNDLGQFAVFLQESHHLQDWRELDTRHLTDYVLNLRERDYAKSTVARKVAAVKSFCHYLQEQNIVHDDLASNVPSPKVEKFIPKAITPDQVQRLLEQPANDLAPESLRDKAMLETLYATGVRVSELTALDVNNVDLMKRELQCGTRPERSRCVPLTDEAIEAIEHYLRVGRPFLRQAPTEPALFLNHRGTRLTRQGFWLILKAYAEAAHIGDITPHTIRHSFAAHALTRGSQLRDIQQILGHMSITTTQVYQRVAAQVAGKELSNGQHAVAEPIAACYDSESPK
ncbi:MAG TPA: tyrosine recombinase [Thermomicrobiaceae bacterium]|nr:tyrosine recombinase [Thermomicrobiaceae bacterium]